MNKRQFSILALSSMVLIATPAWADEYQDTINVFRKAGESGTFFNNAYGYAVFPTIGKGGVGVGGAYGKGRVYEKGKVIGDTSMTQLTVGLAARRRGLQPDHLLRGQARVRRIHEGQLRVRRRGLGGGDHGGGGREGQARPARRRVQREPRTTPRPSASTTRAWRSSRWPRAG